MIETSARLLRLLALFQRRRYWSGKDLAERLEVTSRTLRRDVDKLRSLGYPVHSTSGVEGGYQMGAGTSMPPLLLEDDEAVAVAVGLRAAAVGSIEGIEEASVRALSKIEQIMPARLGRRVAALQAMVVSPEGPAPAVSARTLMAIAAACRENQTLRFRYRDHQGSSSTRTAEPHRMVSLGRRWYLVAWDTDRRDWRTFRVDRIEPRLTLGARFEPRDPPAQDLAAYVTRGVWYLPRYRARVKLLAPAETVAQRLPPYMGVIEPIDERSCYFEGGAASYENLALHVAMLGVDFEVAEPPELLDQMRILAARMLRSNAPAGPRRRRP